MIRKPVNAMSFTHAITEIPFVNITIRKFVLALAVRFAALPFSIVFVAGRISVGTVSY